MSIRRQWILIAATAVTAGLILATAVWLAVRGGGVADARRPDRPART